MLADSSFDVLEFWRGLLERTILITRTARNRCLYYLPQPVSDPGPGCSASYGERAPHPADWLHAGLRNWPSQSIEVRGKFIRMKYQVLGPCVCDGTSLPNRRQGNAPSGWQAKTTLQTAPTFIFSGLCLFRLLPVNGNYRSLSRPLPIKIIFTWLWQRWEIEVAHREMKSGLGVGEKQCWNKRSSIVSVQWSVWLYAVLLLAGYRTWGLPLQHVGGPEQNAAHAICFGVAIAQNCGTKPNFGRFGRKSATTGSKKKPG